MGRKKENSNGNVTDMEVTNIEVASKEVEAIPKRKVQKNPSDKEIYEMVVKLRATVVSERNRRQKAGEKYRQLDRVLDSLLSAEQRGRSLATGGKSTRVFYI